jgi:hypothetical protein
MNTLNTIISSISKNINDNVIEGLTSVGFSNQEATKVVVENSFSLVQDSLNNPVESF